MLKKKWRVNVFISYMHETANPNTYGLAIHSILEHLAWLYELDYAIDCDYQFDSDEEPHEEELNKKVVIDIFYFRTTEYTRISAKEFRQLIGHVFDRSRLFSEGVEVGTIFQKLLGRYPFPDEFYRPLRFPMVEHHKGSQISLKLQSAALELTLPTESNVEKVERELN